MRQVDQLLKSGAKATQKNSSGRTPAQVAAKKDKKGSHSAVLSVLTNVQARPHLWHPMVSVTGERGWRMRASSGSELRIAPLLLGN